MTRTVWVKADDSVGDWEARKRRITTAIEAGADWVLVDEDDVGRVRDLGAIDVAAFLSDADVVDGGGETAEADATFVGKGGEGDGSIDLPDDFTGSADLTTLRRRHDRAQGAYVRVLGTEYEAFAESAAAAADITVVIGEDWSIIPLENLIARVGDETHLVAARPPPPRHAPPSRRSNSGPTASSSTPTHRRRSAGPSRRETRPSGSRSSSRPRR